MKLPPFVLRIQAWIGTLRAILNSGHAAGLWPQQEATPRFMVGSAPQAFMGSVTGPIKRKVVEVGLSNIKKKIDTPEERQVIVDNIHIPGLPARYTWVLSALGAILMALMESASHSDMGMLVNDPRGWAAVVLTSVDWAGLWQAAAALIGLKIAFWTKQDSHSGTVVIPTKAVKGIAEEVK